MSPDRQYHVLVVNHAPEILNLMRELLCEAGYRVSAVPRTGQSLDSIAELAPDAIIIDYMGPSSDNEWTLLNLLNMDRRTRGIPVILCTAAVRHVQEMSDHLLRMGIRAVHKPLDIDHLLGMVGEALDGKSPRRDPTSFHADGQE